MVVANDKHRRYVTFPKDLEKQIEEQSKKEIRDFSNMIVVMCKKYLDELDKDNGME
jgi:metal-responsive CopG/Arc/MetJ family transcriptional regulator